MTFITHWGVEALKVKFGDTNFVATLIKYRTGTIGKTKLEHYYILMTDSLWWRENLNTDSKVSNQGYWEDDAVVRNAEKKLMRSPWIWSAEEDCWVSLQKYPRSSQRQATERQTEQKVWGLWFLVQGAWKIPLCPDNKQRGEHTFLRSLRERRAQGKALISRQETQTGEYRELWLRDSQVESALGTSDR